MKKRLVGIVLVALLSGCSETRWIDTCEVTSIEQRQEIAKHVQAILRATPATLSGNDQDWDDAIRQAHSSATQLYCVPLQREAVVSTFSERRFTGNVRGRRIP